MISSEILRLKSELTTVGYSLTSFEQLGLTFDRQLASELCIAAALGSFSPSAAELTKRIEKAKMTMVQEPRALELGKRMVKPVVETVFKGDTEALLGWDLYAMNSYETGGILGAHQDTVDKTVLIVTASGTRQCDVYSHDQTEGNFKDPENSFLLETGSVLILDAEADPGHAVRCLKGPSVSAVLDVPALLRV